MNLFRFYISFLVVFPMLCWGQEVNYEESQVPSYELPDVLTTESGRQVRSVADWERMRRPELVDVFSETMYGRTPGEHIPVSYRMIKENKNALEGKATMRQIEMRFEKNGKTLRALLLLMLPNAVKKDIPMFIGYNFKGNHSTINDTSIVYSENFKLVRAPDHPDWQPGVQASRWDYHRIIDRGYGVATMCYHDMFPDKEGFKEHSAAALFSDFRSAEDAGDYWQAIGVWAWGSSRIVDYLETCSELDKNAFILVGHSRQGKAALWAGAQDPRFSMVIANNSGSGGAALSKREFGERIAIVSSIKPHWFAKNLDAYHDKEQDMPFDQHMLIALMAPRPVYLGSAEKDLWADPKGEYLAAYHASPVYQLYGKIGLKDPYPPAVHDPIYQDIGYHLRAGIHDLNSYDWFCFLNFADRHFRDKK